MQTRARTQIRGNERFEKKTWRMNCETSLLPFSLILLSFLGDVFQLDTSGSETSLFDEVSKVGFTGD